MKFTRRNFFATLFAAPVAVAVKTELSKPEILKGKGPIDIGLGDYLPGRFSVPQMMCDQIYISGTLDVQDTPLYLSQIRGE